MFTTKKIKITTKTIRKYWIPLSILVVCSSVLLGSVLSRYPEWVRVWAAPVSPDGGERYVEIVKEVPNKCKTEKCLMISYLTEKFQDRADDAIHMIKACENNSFDPTRVSGLNIQDNGRRSYDVGLFQINVDENNKEEMERLKDWKYNIDRAYEKYHAKGDTFYFWTCGKVAGDKTYVDALRRSK